jgi:hypothetical protein
VTGRCRSISYQSERYAMRLGAQKRFYCGAIPMLDSRYQRWLTSLYQIAKSIAAVLDARRFDCMSMNQFPQLWLATTPTQQMLGGLDDEEFNIGTFGSSENSKAV